MTGAGSRNPSIPEEDSAMTATQNTAATRPAVRRTRPSLPTLVGLEVRKSLSTRSGRSVAFAAVLLAPAAMAAAALSGDAIGSAAGPIGAVGLLTAMVLLALGVLSTAGEWSHRTVQTTFLLVPQRGRVTAAKAVAAAALGAALAALAVVTSTAVLAATLGSDLSWTGTPGAMVTVVAAGAAFTVTGAGVGAALGNSPAALTSLYLVLLGVLPVVRGVQPQIGDRIDPVNATLALAVDGPSTTYITILVGWVVVSTAAGAVLTRRRPVQ
jgi:ABC-2 type transport system permease protein